MTPSTYVPPDKVIALLEFMESSTLDQSKGFSPNEDFTPVLFTVYPKNGMGIYGFVAMPHDAMLDAIRFCIILDNATMAGFIATCWQVTQDRDKPLLIKASQDPDRREVVVLTVAYSDGVVSSCAQITRHADKAPTLSEWDRSLDPQHTVGRFAQAMLDGLSPEKTAATT